VGITVVSREFTGREKFVIRDNAMIVIIIIIIIIIISQFSILTPWRRTGRVVFAPLALPRGVVSFRPRSFYLQERTPLPIQ
jgi:hypothetical protein